MKGWPKGVARVPIEHRLSRRSSLQANGCILWTGEKFYNKGRRGKDLYGRIVVNGKKLLAHRVSWSVKNGPIPDGLFVLHKCDVRACINTDHLFLGTHLDNMQDCARKGRTNRHARFRGEDVSTSKLKSWQVLDIRKKHTEGLSSTKIAAIFNVHPATIQRIIKNERWSHVQLGIIKGEA